MNKKYLIFLFLAVFFLLPFERIPTFELLGFTVKLSYIAFLFFLILFLPRLISLFKENKLSISDRFLLLFWLSGLVSLLFTPNLKRSIITLALWAFVFVLYLVFSRLLKNEQLRTKVENIIIISSVLVSIFGIYQFVGDSIGLSTNLTGLREQYTKIVMGFPRIQSVALEPLYFSNYLLIPFFIALKRYFLQQYKNKYSILAIIFLFSLNIILGISRGAYLAIAISLVILFVCFALNCLGKKEKYIKKSAILLAVLFCSALLSLGMVRTMNGSEAGKNFAGHAKVDDTQTGSSVPGRLDGYKIALNLFEKKPIFGNGVASFGPLTVGSEKDLKQFGYGIVNNEYLEILTETGLVGFILFALFVLYLIRDFWQKFRILRDTARIPILMYALGILAIAIQYNFFSTLYIIYIWAFLALFNGEIDSEV